MGNEEESTKLYSCSNILKIFTFALIVVILGSELQMVNDLHQHEGNIQSLTNLTLGSRYFGYARVYRYKGKLKIPSLLNFTQFGFAMGPEFSSDIAGDGPRQRIDADGEYDPELQRIQKKKANKRKQNRKRRRSKAQRQADNLKQHPKRSKADRQADNLKQNPKRSKADRQADNLKQNPKR